jgi:hypothetical protein
MTWLESDEDYARAHHDAWRHRAKTEQEERWIKAEVTAFLVRHPLHSWDGQRCFYASVSDLIAPTAPEH